MAILTPQGFKKTLTAIMETMEKPEELNTEFTLLRDSFTDAHKELSALCDIPDDADTYEFVSRETSDTDFQKQIDELKAKIEQTQTDYTKNFFFAPTNNQKPPIQEPELEDNDEVVYKTASDYIKKVSVKKGDLKNGKNGKV